MNNILPKTEKSYGWSLKESFLFELIFWSNSDVKFKAVASPGKYGGKLKDQLLKLEGSQTPRGKRWFTLFSASMSLDYSYITDLNDAELQKNINEFILKIKTIVDKVERQIIENIEEIINE